MVSIPVECEITSNRISGGSIAISSTEHQRTLLLYIPVASAADAGLLEFGPFDNRTENDQRLPSTLRGDKYPDTLNGCGFAPPAGLPR